ncbi:MucB/RseB C-terminal domain-containing protein [Acidovorax sp. sic0104]|jgi:sigma-E factor negative regulatory protein RseB|uniref:MucB/RseB C-terminal domain-containing protein n=1 Tax=Acidovorax sp. sic0104 TaxID=2854784 RepID=UPI0021052436|nr:MucB/RseB C-terminal domain-containing protein [Acidovorax sp. sic0104]
MSPSGVAVISPVMSSYRWLRVSALAALCSLGISCAVSAPQAGSAAPSASESAAPADRNVAQWIERMHRAPCARPYVGTFVVLSASGAMASSRIWQACDAQQQLEQVEVLSGTPRVIFRRNDEVRTFWPQTRVVRMDRRDAAGLFPRVPAVDGASISQFYVSKFLGHERVAGLAADVVWFKPLDGLRFGYRLWSEKETGLVVKLQTLGPDGRVLEQSAFSELDLHAAVRVEQLSRLMDATSGYKVVAPAVVRTTAKEEGWALRQPVAGFVPVSCHKRAVSATDDAQGVLQCLYSDGLASVSLFMESFDAQRHPAQPQVSSMGATQLLAQKIAPDVWLTVVGEVPMQTLRLFAGQLERIR